MKKITIYILLLALLLGLTACGQEPAEQTDGTTTGKGNSTTPVITTTIAASTTTTTASGSTTTGSTASAATTTTSKTYPPLPPLYSKSSTTTTTTKSTASSATTTSTTSSEPQPVVHLIPVEGEVVEVFHINSVGAYAVLRNPNRLVRIDTWQGELYQELDLPAEPFAVRVMQNEIHISFPSLREIRAYSFVEPKQVGSKSFEHEICSFSYYPGEYMYYTTKDRVYRCKDDGTESVEIATEYAPYKNPIVATYTFISICETGAGDCYAYSYDAKQDKVTSVFDNGGIGCGSYLPKALCHDGALFWGDFELTDGNVGMVGRRFRVDGSASILFVNYSYVMTTDGIFDRASGMLLATFSVDTELGMAGFITEQEEAILLAYQDAAGQSYIQTIWPPM